MITEKILSGVLKKLLSHMAQATGFIQRQRKFSAFEFVLLMTIGQTSMVYPSLSGMVEAIRAKISRVALQPNP